MAKNSWRCWDQAEKADRDSNSRRSTQDFRLSTLQALWRSDVLLPPSATWNCSIFTACFKEMLHLTGAAPMTMILAACLATLQALDTNGLDPRYEPLQADCALGDGSVNMLQKKASHSVPHPPQAHHRPQKAHQLQKVHHDSRHGKTSSEAHHKARHANSTHSHQAQHDPHHHHKNQKSWHKAAKDIADSVFSSAGVSVGSSVVLAGLAPGLSFAEIANQGSHGSPSYFELATHEIEFEWKKGANATLLPRKSKVILALLEGFFLPACLGVDRCYMGQPCIGTIKGLTLGGFFVWYLIDYLFVSINMFMRETYMNRLGFNACFGPEGPESTCFTDPNGPSEVQTAFWITAVFILIKCFFIVFGGRWGGKQVPGDQGRRPFDQSPFATQDRLPYRDPPAIGRP